MVFFWFGDEVELFWVIVLVLECFFDLDCLLWECWIIEGFNGNCWVILIKIYYCMVGVMLVVYLLVRFCDDVDGSVFVNNVDIK